jgi:hypothetical protein
MKLEEMLVGGLPESSPHLYEAFLALFYPYP